MEQSTFQPGDICLECQQNGKSHKLRTFYIDIDEQIVKCESSSCIYPYENDFTDSEDENIAKANQSCSPKPNSLPNLDVISFANNECDDADSVRFVEALLNNTNEIEKTSVVMNTKQELCQAEKLNQNIGLENEGENTTTSASLHMSLQSNDTDHTEDVAFIDALFSNCEAEITQMCESKSLEFIPTRPAPSPTFDMPIISFDFSNNLPLATKQELLLKEDTKQQIDIQCIQTVKAGLASTTNADNTTDMPKVSIKSLELIKTEYIKEEPVVQTAATKQPSEQTDTAISNNDTKVRISRYFDTLRVKQEMLPKTFTKCKKRTNKQQQQPAKSENAAGSSLVNVLAVLRNKTQK
ncbi:PREDICTED: uncharacterized protein LOC108974291 isoform X1 [Bactrocera latifrons]|uniref:uncharacterized protein LOC108974291 isoform X1 n=1 Tax=Bactrocera latifrons TaxID=174628 RepID=UPI0008DDF684|nr:PREDICTED: uncharacterized protein LOC108974291 isoform X1 [Bactrocera latifrons]